MAIVKQTSGREAGLHARVAAGFLVVAAAVFALSLALMMQAALDPERSGPLTVLFPPSWSGERMLLAVARADGIAMRRSWLPGGMQVTARAPGLAVRLKAAGAVLVLPEAPGLFALGGCSGTARLPAAGHERRALPM